MKDRKVILLKACRDLLQKQINCSYVLNLLEEIVHYDGGACDGSCLLDDINAELELINEK